MKTAIVHYWLVGMRGGEKVIEAIGDLFPEADIYTHVYDPGAVTEKIRRHAVRTTFINRLPRATRYYKNYLPLMPFALKRLDLREYDLVISSESGPAKGVRTRPDALHVCYCHTPMRYLWDMYPVYSRSAGGFKRLFIRLTFPWLRRWDRATARGVGHFIANSRTVRERIRRIYGRDAVVIPPPVETNRFAPVARRGESYLMLGQLVAYKRPDLAVEAFSRSGRPLVVIGDGEMRERLERTAGKNVRFLGRQPDASVREHYARCRALVFPGEEDFGIVPVEAMASGRPVLAYGKGGVLDTVIEGRTGLFFPEQTVESLNACVEAFEKMEPRFDPEEIRRHARRFDREIFLRRFKEFVEAAGAGTGSSRSSGGRG